MALYMVEEIPDFRLKFIYFRNGLITTFKPNRFFIHSIREFFSKANNKGLAEEVVKRYYESQGFSVVELYKQPMCSQNLDLRIIADKYETDVECKSFNDKLSLKQLELLFEKKGILVYLERI